MLSLDDTLVGVSPAMRELRAYLPKLARSSATALLVGESGTGKECVAEVLHGMGPRAGHEFVAVNCAALPEALVESELFGHEKGAFTGALGARKGHFRQADGGTLFLDEVGDMSLATQAKLLRVLERREVMPVGSSHTIPVDVRVVAATNQPLDQLVAAHRFRADLFYRLNVAPVALPPLRDRKEDIGPLFGHATKRLNERDRRSVGAADAELLECLMAYDWPGNIRELNNLAEAIFIDPPHGPVELAHLPAAFRKLLGGYQRATLDERRRLLAVLEETRWNKAEAARRLHWSRMTLYRKLSRYGIGADDSP